MNIFQNMSANDWENFSAYYLETIGYAIIEGASVGPDGGKDLIAEKDSIRCLVSCKNNVRSKKSVTLADEDSIPDRMSQHKTQLFIGFYSTKAGDNLKEYLRSSDIKSLIFEGKEISENLENLPFMINQTFFNTGSITQPKIFWGEYEPLLCCCGCGEDLLKSNIIEYASLYLISSNNILNLKWYSNNHVSEVEFIKKFPINKTLHLKQLNDIINEIESIINNPVYKITTQFEINLTKLLELSHQMIYPTDWDIG